VQGLGEVWEIWNICVKLHASMTALHGTIDWTANLQKKHHERFRELTQVQRIETWHSRAAYKHGGWKQPNGQPLTSVTVQMSIQYTAAAQLVEGSLDGAIQRR